ncbi:hypothetical protein HF324_03740 [Chitinophaga oryzae]|uniref:Uncharacterized protein n=1 Tax=Chitinophaga oryzae TaxID=2725414 RepID=A0AAE6ZD92_9BACT|nr:hypothetical protein [Chitinophaga oryzae]QJB30514.1 hypothetical protein HF329_04040 [Chitinophaga oryzae]QJB37013.1 hypothetical protein HF324_03740 [Chitinophaga oryzae]
MNLLFIGIIALSLWLLYLQYKSNARKRSRMLTPVRPASILKINSYTSFGIMATVQFKDDGCPQPGDRIQREEGSLYKITGVLPEKSTEKETGQLEPAKRVWDCRLEKL